MANKLKPCPFCGKEARVYLNDKNSKDFKYIALCKFCGGDIQGPTIKETARKWNNRHIGEWRISHHD